MPWKRARGVQDRSLKNKFTRLADVLDGAKRESDPNFRREVTCLGSWVALRAIGSGKPHKKRCLEGVARPPNHARGRNANSTGSWWKQARDENCAGGSSTAA
jgi:hypothetical protein